MSVIGITFFAIAILYSMVGFGGGSSYIAILALSGVRYELIPLIALLCNLIVVSGGVYFYNKNKLISWNILWPLLLGSVPMAFVGGRLWISKETFLSLLSAVLILVGMRIIFYRSKEITIKSEVKPLRGLLVGMTLGFVSGLVGIGGGIFLAPLMTVLNWQKPKRIAAISSVFIFINSIAGLWGQVTKVMGAGGGFYFYELASYWPAFVAVFLGGQIGSRLGTKRVSQYTIRALTGCLGLFVGFKIAIKLVL